MDDLFTHDRLKEALGARAFRFFAEVTSTQDIAYEWALADPDLPGSAAGDQHAVVIAEQQTAGRGRQGRTWLSPPQSSIMFSAILKPALPPEHLPRVTMLGALAVADTLRPLLGDAVALKWPNDVLVRGKKVCGTLAEATWIGDRLAAVILGIGLNVRVNFDGVSLIYEATSLEPELGSPINRLDLLRELLEHLDHWAARVSDDALINSWRADLGTLGKRVRIHPGPHEAESGSYTGIAESVDDSGALLVRLDSGELRRVVAGDVGLGEL